MPRATCSELAPYSSKTNLITNNRQVWFLLRRMVSFFFYRTHFVYSPWHYEYFSTLIKTFGAGIEFHGQRENEMEVLKKRCLGVEFVEEVHGLDMESFGLWIVDWSLVLVYFSYINRIHGAGMIRRWAWWLPDNAGWCGRCSSCYPFFFSYFRSPLLPAKIFFAMPYFSSHRPFVRSLNYARIPKLRALLRERSQDHVFFSQNLNHIFQFPF